MPYRETANGILYRYLESLQRQERKEFLTLTQGWKTVSAGINSELEQLARKSLLTNDELYRRALYEQFLFQSQIVSERYASYAEGVIVAGQKYALTAGLQSTQEMIGLKVGVFSHINEDAVMYMVGLTQDGGTLYELLRKSYPETAQKLSDTLIQSIALGRNPIETASLLSQDMNYNLVRALRIARTEQNELYRTVGRLQMAESGVCSGWEWIAEPDACGFCLEQNGTSHPLTETMDTHPNCRCGEAPIVAYDDARVWTL